jgi:hypothetical protein
MPVILYVETNFLMSVAMGREAKGNDLLTAINADFRIVVPSGCYMESFSAFEDEQKRRNWFKNELDQQIAQLRRDITSANAASLLANLEQSRIANDNLLNDVLARLFTFVGQAAPRIDQVQPTPGIIHDSVTNMLIPDPTDNLILHSILADAHARPADTKALLTGNTRDFSTPDVEAALKAVDINKHFTNVTAALGWLGSVKP